MANIMIDRISMNASPQYMINHAIPMPRMALNHELISNSEPLGFSRQISGLLQGALSLSSVRVWNPWWEFSDSGRHWFYL